MRSWSRPEPIISRLLGYEIARYVFGRQGEFLRRAQSDETVRLAVSLLAGAANQRTVFARADAARDSSTRVTVPRAPTGD